MLITNVTNINANIVKKIGANFWVPESGLPPGAAFWGFLVVCGVSVDFGVLTFPESILWVSNELVGVGLGFVSPSVELEGLEDWGPGPGPGPFADDDDAGVGVGDVGVGVVVAPSTSIRVTARMAIIANIFRDVISNPMFFAFASSSPRFPYSHSLK